MDRFKNKLCVITASTAGIGFAIAQRFLEEGAHVVISSRKERNVNRTVQQLKSSHSSTQIAGVRCDVSDKEQRANLFRFAISIFPGLTKIDILVSNAACSPYIGMTLETPENAWDRLFDINVKSSFFLISEARDLLSDGGAILIVSSYLAFSPVAPIGIYGVTKTALLGLTKALAAEFAERRIRVRLK